VENGGTELADAKCAASCDLARIPRIPAKLNPQCPRHRGFRRPRVGTQMFVRIGSPDLPRLTSATEDDLRTNSDACRAEAGRNPIDGIVHARGETPEVGIAI